MRVALMAAGLVFVAELGDKTQLVILGAGVRRRRARVMAALLAVIAALAALAVTVGSTVDRLLPDRLVGVVAGALFCMFAVMTWRGDDDAHTSAVGGSVARVAFVFALAELGDKSMFGAASLAADRDALSVWVGATVGESAAVGLSLVAGGWLAHKVRPALLRQVGAAAFAGVGLLTILTALT